MNRSIDGFVYRHPQRERHLLLGVIAFVLSVMLHMGLVYWTRDMRIDASEFVDQARSEQQQRNRQLKPLHVERTSRDPQRPMLTDKPVQSTVVQATADQLVQLFGPLPELGSPQPPAPEGKLADTKPEVSKPEVAQSAVPLLPRQEVATIVAKRIDDALAALPRREVAAIERVAAAPDFAPAVDLTAGRFAAGTGFRPSDMSFGFKEFEAAALAPPKADIPSLPPPADLDTEGREATALIREIFADAPEATQRYTAIDDRLDLAISLFRDEGSGRAYFRLSIRPQPDKPLPSLPKDMLLVQDCSASMSEARLHFCRHALTQIVEQLGPDDRFNIMAFSDAVSLSFETWGTADDTHKAQAFGFIKGLRARGETDLFASLQRALDIPRAPDRPMVALIITDGKPTVGLTASTAIIGSFTKINDGNISVLGFGTHPRANTYLLDMLTYCNRGETSLNRSGRWNLPADLTAFTADVANPVMHDVRFVFDSASGSEVYPKLTMNLYAGRSLDLYGSCAASVKEMVVQLRGRAVGQDYDAIVNINLDEDTAPGTVELRDRWAWQRMYHLIGLYARDPKPIYREVMQGLHTEYGIPIPYLDDLDR